MHSGYGTNYRDGKIDGYGENHYGTQIRDEHVDG